MAKPLRKIVPNQKNSEGISPEPQGEKDFAAMHAADKNDDRNGNKDEVFDGSNVKTYDREKDRMGENPKAWHTRANKVIDYSLDPEFTMSNRQEDVDFEDNDTLHEYLMEKTKTKKESKELDDDSEESDEEGPNFTAKGQGPAE